MFFPEKLDDRTFRVFVQRTCHLLKTNLALSTVEQQLAMLIKAFPELGLLKQKKDININVQYPKDVLNPFAFLAAAWQVWQQLITDSPKGYRNIVSEFFDPKNLESEELLVLAGIYESLFMRAKEEAKDFTEKDYLYEVQYLLQNPDEFDYYEEEAIHADNYEEDLGLITPDMVGNLVDEYVQRMYEEESTRLITLQSKFNTLLNKMPATWVNAISSFWQLPAEKLKRDRIQSIVAFLTNKAAVQKIRDSLTTREKEALHVLAENDGYVKYNVLAKKIGGEDDDSYWWEDDPPESTIGRLRLMGLAVVGKIPIGGRRYKSVIIPKEVRAVVAKVLQG